MSNTVKESKTPKDEFRYMKAFRRTKDSLVKADYLGESYWEGGITGEERAAILDKEHPGWDFYTVGPPSEVYQMIVKKPGRAVVYFSPAINQILEQQPQDYTPPPIKINAPS